MAPDPAHSRPTEPNRSICSLGLSKVTQPASVEPYSSYNLPFLKNDMMANLVSLRAGADEIINFSTADTSYFAFTASGNPSIMM